jgi:hypothetical protein
MSARNSSSSFLLVLCAWTLPSVCSFAQLIYRTHDGYQLTSEDRIEEMVAAAALRSEFRVGKSRYIHFPAKLLFDSPQGRKQFRQSDGTNDKQINIALRLFLAARDRSIDSRPRNLGAEAGQFGFEKWDEPRRLGKQAAKFLIHRGGGLGFVIAAPPVLRALQYAAFGEGFEFALKTGG